MFMNTGSRSAQALKTTPEMYFYFVDPDLCFKSLLCWNVNVLHLHLSNRGLQVIGLKTDIMTRASVPAEEKQLHITRLPLHLYSVL